jgi:hypothetical protein
MMRRPLLCLLLPTIGAKLYLVTTKGKVAGGRRGRGVRAHGDYQNTEGWQDVGEMLGDYTHLQDWKEPSQADLDGPHHSLKSSDIVDNMDEFDEKDLERQHVKTYQTNSKPFPDSKKKVDECLFKWVCTKRCLWHCQRHLKSGVRDALVVLVVLVLTVQVLVVLLI